MFSPLRMGKDHFLLISLLLVAVAAASHAALPAQVVYWNRILPKTPMPGAIQNLLRPTDAYVDEKTGTSVGVGKGGVTINTGNGEPSGTSVNVDKGGVNVDTGKDTSVNVDHGGVNVNTGKGKPGGTTVKADHGGVGVTVNPGKGHGGTTVVVGHSNPFFYRYAATETQIHDDPTVALFFLEKDLRPGAKMTLHFTGTTTGAAFLSRQEASAIPFTSAKLPEILNHFSVEPNSIEAESMKATLQECEEPAQAGETKLCATSLESMVEFSTSSLGTRNVQAMSTVVGKEGTPKQLYTIAPSGVQKVARSKLVVCHAQTYAYAVFYCHTTRATKAYQVTMVGEDGTKVKAVAVCHTDTASWNPKHVAFQVLNVKPGTVPVCHFLPQDHLVWSLNK